MSKTALERGGWRYDPYTTESDVSVSCWQLLVLHTARQAGFEVEQPVFSAALAYLNRAYTAVKAETGQGKNGAASGYLYRPGYTHEPSRSSTALVLFIQSLFGATDEQRTRQALMYLRRYPLTWDGNQYGGYFFFSGFYMVQGMFQIGGEEWASFGPRMAALLLDHQAGDGTWPYPPGNFSQEQMQSTGAAYPVAMAVLMLSLDKQYLPMYQRQSRIYESGSTVLRTAEPPSVEVSATATKGSEGKASVPTPELVPDIPSVPTVEVGGPGPGGDGNVHGGADEDEEEPEVARPIGSPLGW
jgi:hypothetical protein